MKCHAVLCLVTLLFVAKISAAPSVVTIENSEHGFQLLRNGEPYVIRGAGTQLPKDLASLAHHGGNSVRTWSSDNALEMLDRAQELGLTVAMCLDVKRERHGFDYNDKDAVRLQHKTLLAEAARLKNHPALLFWILGNELNLEYKNPRVYDAVNDLAVAIHEIDGNHPITTTTAGISPKLAKVIGKRAPAIDFLSVQVYGGLFSLNDTLQKLRWDKPIMITEWGTIGHWEVEQTGWGAPLELSSREKAFTYLRGYEDVIQKSKGQLLGNYVFLWSNKQERTPTWYGMFLPDGKKTQSVDIMHRIWRGKWPADTSPVIREMTLNGLHARQDVHLTRTTQYLAKVDAYDHEGSELRYQWVLLKESDAKEVGGDAEDVPDDYSHLLDNSSSPEVTINLISEPGPYRLYVYVSDDQGVGHANIPFLVR